MESDERHNDTHLMQHNEIIGLQRGYVIYY